ncbi:hypothetical protein [Roseateles cavernae]|uniref:hypothetical protein n=1 Tax=Roseateles cavernae TaxID=3153578 RepID=UPI0032E52CBB
MSGDYTQQLAQRLIEISNEHSLEMTDDARHSLESAAEQLLFLKQQVARTETVCDAVYLERNQVVAALAKCFPSGIARTAIEGWAPEWHGCVYIDLPTGQASWHYHDREAHLFEGLPPYAGQWDGHDTPEKYRRLAALPKTGPLAQWNGAGWRKECADTDALLRRLGLEPEQCRTDGGWLNLPRIEALLAAQPAPPTLALDAAGQPKLKATVLEQQAVQLLNTIKASPAFYQLPLQVIMSTDAVLMMAEQRRTGIAG